MKTDLRDASWTAIHVATQHTIVSDGYNKRIGEGHNKRPHPAASLIYPDSMFIWGGDQSNYIRPTQKTGTASSCSSFDTDWTVLSLLPSPTTKS